ncbi:porin family protein [Tenacibaculum sp. M341]|uniref:porin family protein n=1 Tax=Tenacibaculum sp. M341 TaxID=2530339 RepID=UPI0010495CC4|nr:porin family protein [Tenacibaculum sp. M341]TCI84496.1 PorT family protein [Tenacibaculum sp. M341]
MKTKKIAKLLFISILFFNKINAQKRITFGVHGGLNYSSLREKEAFPDSENLKNSEFSFITGISSNYYFSNNLSLKVELNYESKKDSRNIPSSIQQNFFSYKNSKTITNASFITLPILLKYEFGNSKNPFFINGGTFLGYLIKLEDTFPDETTADFTDRMTNFDFGVSLGVGKKFSMDTKNNLIIEIRDNLGLTSISKFVSYKTNSLNLIIGWEFTL